jgi:hypothetical protein
MPSLHCGEGDVGQGMDGMSIHSTETDRGALAIHPSIHHCLPACVWSPPSRNEGKTGRSLATSGLCTCTQIYISTQPSRLNFVYDKILITSRYIYHRRRSEESVSPYAGELYTLFVALILSRLNYTDTTFHFILF